MLAAAHAGTVHDNSYRATLVLRGSIGTLSRHTICRERGLTLVPLTLARLPLFHRRLDGDMVACREHVAVKIRYESEQTLSVQRYMRAGSILVNAIT